MSYFKFYNIRHPNRMKYDILHSKVEISYLPIQTTPTYELHLQLLPVIKELEIQVKGQSDVVFLPQSHNW